MTQTNSDKPDNRRFPKKTVGALGALAVAALLVGAVLSPSSPEWLTPERSQENRAEAAVNSIDSLADLHDMAGPVAADADAQIGALEGYVAAETDAAIAHALGLIDTAMAQADMAGEVAALADASILGAVGAPALPALPEVPDLDVEGILSWTSMPTDLVPREPFSELPTALPSLGDDLPELPLGEGPLGDLGLGDLGLGDLGGLPVGDLDSILGGLPLPIAMGDDAPGTAYDTASPDEEGATVAAEHAIRFLGTAGDGYGAALDAGGDVLADLDTLVDDVEDRFDTIHASVVAAETDATEQLAARLAATESLAADTTAELSAKADGALDALFAAHAEAAASLEAHFDGLQAKVDAVESAHLEAIARTMTDLQASADAQVQQVRHQAETALEGLTDESAAQSIVDAAIEATASIDADLQSQLETLGSVQARVQSHADRVSSTIGSARTDAVAQVTAAHATASTEVAGLLASGSSLVEGHIETVSASHVAAVESALAQIRADAQARSEEILEVALEHAGAATEIAGDVTDLADDVVMDAYDHLSVDLDYILKVSEDLGRVPVPDRQAQAEAWAMVHGDLAKGWNLLDQATLELMSMAEDLESEAQASLSGLASLS